MSIFKLPNCERSSPESYLGVFLGSFIGWSVILSIMKTFGAQNLGLILTLKHSIVLGLCLTAIVWIGDGLTYNPLLEGESK